MNTAVRQPTFEIKMNIRSSRVYSAPVPKMPPGLVELMEGLARDVLKNNPTEVYEFCAEHMQKLLQVRDGPTKKNSLTLKQKIANATAKIKDREAKRRDEFDKKIQSVQHFQSDQNYNDEMIPKYDTEAEQYIQENVVKISQNHLAGNIEHEIIAGATQVANIKNITPSDSKPQDEIDLRNGSHNVNLFSPEHDNITKIEEEPSEFKLNESTDDNSIEEKRIEIKDELALSIEDHDENVLKENFDEEQTHLNASNPTIIADSDIKIVDENNDKIHINILKDNTQSIDCSETTNALNEVDNSSTAINIDEHKDLNGYNDKITNNPNNLKNCHKEEENNYQVDTILETTEGEQTTSIDTNITSGDITVKEKNVEEKSDEIIESLNNTNVKFFDETAENELKNNYGESHGHVHNNSMDLETAAITIQKVFRSFLFRNKTSSVEDSTNIYMNLLIEDKEKKDDEAMSTNNIKDRRSLGISRMDTVLQTVNEEKSLSLSTDDSSTLSSAATIIQAHVRGFLVRNNFNINKTASSTSGIDSDAQSMTSLEGDVDCNKNKTVLNIHIVPEGGHYMSRDESMLTSIDLSLDGSPPNSTNLHPLGYDKSERRKQLKREDAIQSISPPSNNSGKLSEDVDSVKEVLLNSDNDLKCEPITADDVNSLNINEVYTPTHALNDDNISTVINNVETEEIENIEESLNIKSSQPNSLSQLNSDELDVVTPFVTLEETVSSDRVENDIKLMHSGECHDVVLPTKVSRNDTSVVRGE